MRLAAAIAASALVCGAAVWLAVHPGAASQPANRFMVSQRGREFNPRTLTLRQGDEVRIVNDDEDLTHHAYIASKQLNFDSGDQQPGRNVDITFNKSGTFDVLCGIHPKMRLTVTVHPAEL